MSANGELPGMWEEADFLGGAPDVVRSGPAVPDPRFRDQLAVVLRTHRLAGEDHEGAMVCACGWTGASLARHQAGYVAAEVEARVQAAANQRAVERQWASETAWIEGYEACRRGDQPFRNPYRAAALASPAPAPRAEEGQR